MRIILKKTFWINDLVKDLVKNGLDNPITEKIQTGLMKRALFPRLSP